MFGSFATRFSHAGFRNCNYNHTNAAASNCALYNVHTSITCSSWMLCTFDTHGHHHPFHPATIMWSLMVGRGVVQQKGVTEQLQFWDNRRVEGLLGPFQDSGKNRECPGHSDSWQPCNTPPPPHISTYHGEGNNQKDGNSQKAGNNQGTINDNKTPTWHCPQRCQDE